MHVFSYKTQGKPSKRCCIGVAARRPPSLHPSKLGPPLVREHRKYMLPIRQSRSAWRSRERAPTGGTGVCFFLCTWAQPHSRFISIYIYRVNHLNSAHCRMVYKIYLYIMQNLSRLFLENRVDGYIFFDPRLSQSFPYFSRPIHNNTEVNEYVPT